MGQEIPPIYSTLSPLDFNILFYMKNYSIFDIKKKKCAIHITYL